MGYEDTRCQTFEGGCGKLEVGQIGAQQALRGCKTYLISKSPSIARMLPRITYAAVQ
jgi:hypothetical protein